MVGDIIFDEELRGTVVGNIISSTSSFDYRSLSLFVSRERKRKVEVVPISLPLLRSTTKYTSNFGGKGLDTLELESRQTGFDSK